MLLTGTGLEPPVFRSRVRRSTNWATPSPQEGAVCFFMAWGTQGLDGIRPGGNWVWGTSDRPHCIMSNFLRCLLYHIVLFYLKTLGLITVHIISTNEITSWFKTAFEITQDKHVFMVLSWWQVLRPDYRINLCDTAITLPTKVYYLLIKY